MLNFLLLHFNTSEFNFSSYSPHFIQSNYEMKVIGWLRIVRPGTIIGPQQQYMKDMQVSVCMGRVCMCECEGGREGGRESVCLCVSVCFYV